ncbi:MAG: bifunctional (p)ppGpp synthetase/guanosine-3',5'-bis(diphosphate) 3'-pyrophosphohydrolase [Muribaculaceae bacterium]|nr:bifunctional (p)ppGpp synthetase/guanosine-3',5'-bis(diphosphate) 3'-pyrophosphohydrolase [Muribaculaceae bacterium]
MNNETKDYERIINDRAQRVFDTMEPRTSAEDMERLKAAFELAKEAHAPQKRKSGEPYILHPIAVAQVAAEELMLDPNTVMACFLHDVVEDTDYSLDDIKKRFGSDVAMLVRVVTKKASKVYEFSKQLDNYKQLLDSLLYDTRAILVKLADRLHNMRTLTSMKAEKQIKIAGETDYFYAPLANRLGLYNIKTELENLSFRFRCPDEYEEISMQIAAHVERNRDKLNTFRNQLQEVLEEAGIKARVTVDYRRPFSLWRKMKKYGDDFNHLKYRHYIEVVFDDSETDLSEKEMALRVYCILTNRFKEKHGSISNYIDSPKENGYQSLHVKLLPDFGRWQEVHISSESMARRSQIGYLDEKNVENIRSWIEKFRKLLVDTIKNPKKDAKYMEDVTKAFYNDDIQVFTPKGEKVILPQNSTALDFAYEVHTTLGNHAKYARINGRLDPITTTLRRGDVVEIYTDEEVHPDFDWNPFLHTFKARKAVRRYLEALPERPYNLCKECHPIPGEEIVGIKSKQPGGKVMLHKRDCQRAISLASSYGDDVVDVTFPADDTLYPVELMVRAVDRHHLLIDLADCITNKLQLSMESFNTQSNRGIVVCSIRFRVHSAMELKQIIRSISSIDGVDEVKRVIAE